MNETLSIYVPTFNRSHYLRECLASILPEAERFGIPVFISDNASMDDTEQVVRNAQHRYPGIFYRKSERNVGLDMNQLAAIDQVNTKYFLWLGDDDMLVRGKGEGIIARLDKEKPSLLFVKAMNFAGHPQNVIGFNIRDAEETVLSDCRVFLAKYCYKMLYGTLIVNTQLARSVDASRFIGTNNAFSGLVLEYLAKEYIEKGHNRIIVDTDPKVYLRKEAKTWHREAAELALLQVPEWFHRLHPLYSDEVALLLPSYIRLQTNLLNLLRHRISGSLNINTFSYLLGQYPFLPAKLNGFFALLAPAWLAKFAAFAKREYLGQRLQESIEKRMYLQ